jgi:sterol desaturase/sphingolipid hydroxylase (fatty acid hydroxylase superfamily)
MEIGFALIMMFALLLAAGEVVSPARTAVRSRWPVNIGLGVVTLILLRLLAVAGPFAAAGWAQSEGIGLFNQVDLPQALVWLFVIIAMDFAIYWQHRASHGWGWFWALHRLHHADTDFDLTTGLRFHPGEAMVSMAYKSTCGVLLGAPPEAMIAFELYLAAGSLFEHANVRLPAPLQRMIDGIWVTPAMHIVHHDAQGDGHRHNYGFAIAIWDQLFGTARIAPMPTRIGAPA